LSVAVVSDAGSSIAIEANELLATAAHWSHWNMMFCKVPGKKREGLSISTKTMYAQAEQRLGIIAGSSQVRSKVKGQRFSLTNENKPSPVNFSSQPANLSQPAF